MTRTPNRSRQTLELLGVLAARAMIWSHGYELSKLTGLKSGTLYPMLMRLHEQGLLEDRWEPSDAPGRPPRHAYRLTAQGRAVAREAATQTRSPRLTGVVST
jgi:DNA-binding PadR family transcriptional regulator